MAGGALAYGATIYQGQRFFSPTSDAWNPVAVGPVRSTVPAPIPTVAPMNSGPGLSGGSSVSSKWNPLVIFGLLAASLLLLHYVHFRG